jgi:O-antigen/teichoic acid export membrane protein
MDGHTNKRGIFGDTVWRTLQVIAEVVAQFFIFFFVAKWLEPRDFGFYSLIIAIVYFFQIFSDFGLSRSSSKYLAENFARGEKGKPKSIILVSLLLSFIFLSVVCLIYMSTAGLIGRLAQNEQLSSLITFSTPLLFFATLFLLLDGLFRGARSIKPLAIIDITSKILQFSLLILFIGVFHYGVRGAIAGVTIGYAWFVVIALFFLVKKIYCPLKERLDLKPAFKNVLSYGYTNGLMALAIYFYTKIDILILGYFCDANEVGKYSFAIGITNLPFFFLAAYAAVVAPVITREHTLYNSASLQRIFTRSISATAYFMVFLSIVMFLFSGTAVHAFFPEYESSILLLKILSFSLLLRGLGLIAGHAFLVPTGNASINTRILIVGAILNTILDFILIPKYGAIGSVIVTIIVHTLTNITCVVLTVRKLGLRLNLKGILYPFRTAN